MAAKPGGGIPHHPSNPDQPRPTNPNLANPMRTHASTVPVSHPRASAGRPLRPHGKHAALFIPLALACVCASLSASAPGQSHSYDAAGRLIWSTQPSGAATAFGYDPAGNILSVAVVTPGRDIDGDGLPDSFEIEWSGSTTGMDAMADFNGSGRVNLLEYALALDPLGQGNANPTPVSIELSTDGTDSHLTLRFRRPVYGPQSVEYAVEVSGDLAQDSWSSDPGDVEILQVESLGGGIEEVTVRATLPLSETDRLFLRLRVQAKAPTP